MAEPLLSIQDLCTSVGEKQILKNISLDVAPGEIHVLMGPNGAGKSTLGYTLMGSPEYSVTGGKIVFNGQDITADSADKRAKSGIFLSFQEPLEVPGVSLESFIRSSMQQVTGQKVKLMQFSRELEKYMEASGGSLIVITHSTRILENLSVDKTHIIVKGRLVHTGDGSLVQKINEEGFDGFIPQEIKDAERKEKLAAAARAAMDAVKMNAANGGL